MAAPPPTKDQPEDPPVATVVDEFLAWTEQHREKRTYGWYLNYLQEFVVSLPQPTTFPVSRLKPYHVEKWVDAAKERWGASCRHGAIRSVQRCFRWAEKQGYIEMSPVRHIEKPTPQRREKVIALDEYRTILSHYKEVDPFRDMLMFAWETGARAQEIRIIERRHYREDKKRIEIPPAEAKTKRWRVIFLTDSANAIMQKMVKRNPIGTAFRNEDGKAWTTFSMSCRFARLEKKLKERYCLTNFRHSWCQRMLEDGMDSITVAALMGHASAAMVQKNYSHMDKAHDYLAERLRQTEGGGGVTSE